MVVRLGLAVVCTLALLASPAMAGQISLGYPGSAYGPYQTGAGGEYTLNAVGGWLGLSGYVAGVTSNVGGGITSFQSFCIEVSEIIQSTTYNAQVNTVALNGGVGPAGDPLSVGTGWLYSQFAMGVLQGYNYGGTASQRKQSAAQLQAALWWLEGGASFSSSNIFMAAVVAQFGSKSAAKATGAALYGVYALNLWKGSNPARNRAQDQLYFAGLPTSVPDASATFTLFGIGLLGLAALRRYSSPPRNCKEFRRDAVSAFNLEQTPSSRLVAQGRTVAMWGTGFRIREAASEDFTVTRGLESVERLQSTD